MSSGTTTLLTCSGLTKRYGGVSVLTNVSLALHASEIHAVCGENGAGKSTFMSLLAGILTADEGTITRSGGPVAMVFQERSLFGSLSIAENILAARQPVNRLGLISRADLITQATSWLATIAPELDPRRLVDDLSPAEQQLVEIAKALSQEAKVIIFDEPTAALTATETDRLFRVLRKLRSDGLAVAYISHRLDEVFLLADTISVLKDGQLQGTWPARDLTRPQLISQMVGHEIVEHIQPAPLPADASSVLEVTLNDPPSQASWPRLKDVSFHLKRGEILGLGGLAGSGRTEAALCLFGLREYARSTSQILLDGNRVAPRSAAAAMAHGLGYLTEDRKDAGLFLELSISSNVVAGQISQSTGFNCSAQAEATLAERFCQKLEVVCRGVQQPVGDLSGGNQQKVLLARWILLNPRILIVDEPTRGVDVGAKRAIHELLVNYAAQGGSVLLISSDLPELLALSHRISVMKAGTLAGTLGRADATEQAFLNLAA